MAPRAALLALCPVKPYGWTNSDRERLKRGLHTAEVHVQGLSLNDKADGVTMTFSQQLRANANLVEGRLQELLGASANSVPPRLAEAMRYAVLGGGKRFRPFLVLESAKLFGLEPSAALNAAAAIELIHCYSLVHWAGLDQQAFAVLFQN